MNDTQKAISEVIKQFDFKKVASVMGFVKWTYHNSLTSPTAEELQSKAIEHLNYLVDNNKPELRAGGFTYWYDNSDNSLGLYFVLEDTSTEFTDPWLIKKGAIK